jgi:hypothetical protein
VIFIPKCRRKTLYADKESLAPRASVAMAPDAPVRGRAEGSSTATLDSAQAGHSLFAADLDGLRNAVIACRTEVRVIAVDARAWVTTLECRLVRGSEISAARWPMACACGPMACAFKLPPASSKPSSAIKLTSMCGMHRH